MNLLRNLASPKYIVLIVFSLLCLVWFVLRVLQSPSSRDLESENQELVQVVVTEQQLKAGSRIDVITEDQLWDQLRDQLMAGSIFDPNWGQVSLLYVDATKLTGEELYSLEEVNGRILKSDLDSGVQLQESMLLPEGMLTDVLFSENSIPEGTLITIDMVRIEDMPLYAILPDERPLNSMDYFHLGRLTATETIEAGDHIDWSQVSLDEPPTYSEIMSENAIETDSPMPSSELIIPNNSEIQEIVNFSFWKFAITFMVGALIAWLVMRFTIKS